MWEIVKYIGAYGEIWDIERIQENIRKHMETFENIGQCRKIQRNIAKYWKNREIGKNGETPENA